MILVLALLVGAWLVFRVLTVKAELEAAQKLVSSIQDSSSDEGSLTDTVAELGEHAEAAASVAGDPVWRVFEAVPVAGDNLRAVRLSSEALDVLSNNIGAVALKALSDDSDASPLAAILPALQAQSPRVAELAADIAEIAASESLIGPVRSGVEQVDAVLQVAAPAIEVLPVVLGGDGAKNYLLVFQNNAESLPLGGSAASQTLVSVDNGQISIAGQASSANFVEGEAVDVAVDQSAIDLYGSYLLDHVNTATSRPDFPTAAQILTAFWQRDVGDQRIDGVVSLDPLALARILKATGSIAVGDVELTSDNVVQVLLSDVYTWWDPYASKAEALASDAFFASVATQVFARVSGGDFDLKDMLWAVNESITQGSLMMWSDNEQIASLIDGQRIEGTLPTDNVEATTVGVFFRDSSKSKIDYYMDSAVDLAESCEADVHTFTTSTTLHLNISQSDADSLPEYVASGVWGSDQFYTEIFVYGPPGTTVQSVSVDGRDVQSISTDVVDLGRPVASFATYLRPDEAATVTASFAGSGTFGPLAARTTPMVRSTEVSATSACG